MTDMAGIAGNAVSVYQQALSTVSNNIANVSTDGYSRQDVSLSALPVTKAGNVFMGSGVAMDRVKRQYDAFVESNLRNTTSDLEAQGPMVNYANRVVDVLGSSTMGLNTALDAFFASARTVSGDPSSTVLRSSFVRDAQGVADRFGQLSAQLDLVQEQTQHELDNSVNQINALTSQIAKVNIQLAKQKSEESQPPDLMDQRDLLLKQLSEFAHINTRFTPNGIVTVSFGPTINADVVVDGQRALMIQANYNEGASPEKASLVLDPYGKPSALNGISSGSLAGIMNFRDQVLGSTRNALDGLAKTFANEINTLHQQGIDGYGNPGQALFTFDSSIPSAAGGMRVAFEDPLRVAAGAQFRVTEGSENPSGTNASVRYDEKPAPAIGAPNTPPPPPGPPALQTVVQNSGNVSTARQVSVSSSLGVAAVATIANGMQDVSLYLDGMQSGQQLQIYTRDGRQLLGSPLTDSVALDNLMTKENGFAAGATLSDQYLKKPGVPPILYKGMEVFYGAQATVQAQPIFDGKDAVSGYNYLPAVLQGSRISPLTATTMNPPLGYFPAGAFQLNGQDLGRLDPPVGAGPLQASAVANWINGARETTGVTAKASNVIVVKPEQMKFGMPLYIQGQAVITAGANTAQALANAINDANTSVQATVNAGGDLVIRNSEGHAGEDISISATLSNSSGILSLTALGMGATTFRGEVELVKPAVEPIVVDTSKMKLDKGLIINGQTITLPSGMSAPLTRAKLLAIASAINDRSDATNVTARLSADNQSLILGSIAQGTNPKITISGSILTDGQGRPQVDPLQNEGNRYRYDDNALGRPNGAWPAEQVNELTVKADQIKYGNPLYFKDAGNWVKVSTAGIDNVQDLAKAIDSAHAGVSAEVVNGDLVIRNASDRIGRDIRISASPSDATGTSSLTALGLSANTFKVQVKVTPSGPIQLGFGATGTPSDLAQLGFRTGAFISGAAKDDLLVFVSGPGNAAVSASYSGQPVDAKQSLRTQTLEVKFIQDTEGDPPLYDGALYYTISSTDPSNPALGSTVVAERVFNPAELNPGIRFQGLNLSFTSAPQPNDVFKLDGNQDGLGNNDNMLAIAALETKAVVGNKTLTNSYIDQVNEMGNIARQATISQTALTVVHEQAIKSRDEISGVSLDKEAADLIRYQQAYQASAKVLQVAGQLFDAVLRVQ